jgi:three-Cys-motif partner protein
MSGRLFPFPLPSADRPQRLDSSHHRRRAHARGDGARTVMKYFLAREKLFEFSLTKALASCILLSNNSNLYLGGKMTKPSETLWEIEPHTKAKHEILGRYLGAWFAILGSKIPRIIYIDGFCGPGKYLGGEDGSPIIALKEALKQPVLRNSKVSFLFIDERADRIDHLKNEIDHLKSETSFLTIPPNFYVDAKVNEFENTLTTILDDLQKDGHHLAPTFAFVDPFGFKGAPFSLIKRLLENSKTEVFVNIMVDFINRFIEHPTPITHQHIKQLLGASDTEIDQIINSQDRISAFRQFYQNKLRQYAKFVRFFEMRDYRNKVIYYLFFASNHRLGHKKMKEAFWKVDSQSGFKFSDRTDPKQDVLFELDPSMSLKEVLKKHFAGTTQLSENIITFVEDETAYTESHAKKALIHLENEKEISVNSMKSDGAKRIKFKFPNGVIIHF